MTRVEWALRYAEQGYRVMPAFAIKNKDTGKTDKVAAARTVLLKPCPAHVGQIGTEAAAACKGRDGCKGGEAAATTDPAYIRWMWKQRPTALVAVLPAPGVLIIDDDSQVFDDVWGTLPRVRSVSGNHHYWLRLGPGQAPLPSENGILFHEPDGKIDLRGTGDKRWILAPCGQGSKGCQPENGWTSDPARLLPLPDAVHRRIVEAPRATEGGDGGPGGQGWAAGLPVLHPFLMGIDYDREDGICDELLEQHGWSTDDGAYWTRPGGSHTNAQLSVSDGGIWFFSVYTTNDEFLHGDRWYTASMLRAVLDYGGDWRTCYAALTKEGHLPFFNAQEGTS